MKGRAVRQVLPFILSESGVFTGMKFRKVIIGILFLGALSYPVRVLASGTLSGIGLLAGEEENDNPDIYQMTFPTGGELGIIIDPEGLLSISQTGEYDSSWAGMVHMKDNEGALFINRSSFPVIVKVGISIEQDTDGTPSGIALLENDAYVDDGGWPQMYLAAVPGEGKIQSFDEFTASDKEIPILANGNGELTTFSFLLDSAEYILDEESGNYVLADYEDNYDSASFILDGRVNRNADWSAYVGPDKEDLIIRAVYTIQKQSSYDEQSLYQPEGESKTPYALMKENEKE